MKIKTEADLRDTLEEIERQTDRGAAIVGAALIENFLQEMIADQWPPMSKSVREDVFTGNGPLAAFSAKVRIANAMGLIGPTTKGTLRTLNHVRNDFAHEPGPISFASAGIAEKIAAFPFPIRPKDLSSSHPERARFMAAFRGLAVRLIIREHLD